MLMKRILYSLLLVSFLSINFSSVFAQADAGDARLLSNTKETTVSLYPLPTNGTLHISFNKTMNELPAVLIYDMIGNLVDNISLDREAAGSFTINMSGKRAGFYFIKIQAGDESFSRRITVTQ